MLSDVIPVIFGLSLNLASIIIEQMADAHFFIGQSQESWPKENLHIIELLLMREIQSHK
tara:strand:- start:392 stop:568 length:177 start_codon:yes stop_codon:yes gene_type:complete